NHVEAEEVRLVDLEAVRFLAAGGADPTGRSRPSSRSSPSSAARSSMGPVPVVAKAGVETGGKTLGVGAGPSAHAQVAVSRATAGPPTSRPARYSSLNGPGRLTLPGRYALPARPAPGALVRGL